MHYESNERPIRKPEVGWLVVERSDAPGIEKSRGFAALNHSHPLHLRSLSMSLWSTLIFVGGILHFCLLSAGAMVPGKLDFRGELSKVKPMLRELVWTYYVFIALCIVGFAVLSVAMPVTLASGSPLSRAVCGFIAAFWT